MVSRNRMKIKINSTTSKSKQRLGSNNEHPPTRSPPPSHKASARRERDRTSQTNRKKMFELNRFVTLDKNLLNPIKCKWCSIIFLFFFLFRRRIRSLPPFSARVSVCVCESACTSSLSIWFASMRVGRST